MSNKSEAALVQKAYDTIYDYLMNRSDSKKTYELLWKKEERIGDWFYQADSNLFELLYELRDCIRYKRAKENGNGNLHKVIEKLIKKEDCSRPQLSGIYKDKNGYTWYTNSFVLFRTESELELPQYEAPPINYEAIVEQSDYRFMREVFVPSTAKLKEYKKLNKNNLDARDGSKLVYFVCNENGEAVAMFDIDLLLNCREGVGDDAKCYVQNGYKSRISPLVMVTESTYALVVPMRQIGDSKTKWEE